MSDLLTRVLPAGRDLLARVDRVLHSYGIPAAHPILPLISEWKVLPGEVLEFTATLRPHALYAAAETVPRLAPLPPPPTEWNGPAAEAFGTRWRQLDAHHRDLAARLEATAEYAAAAADWMTRLRQDVAVAVASVVGSAEAVTVKTKVAWGVTDRGGGSERVQDVSDVRGAGIEQVNMAAATIGCRILGAVSVFELADWPRKLAGGNRGSKAFSAFSPQPREWSGGFEVPGSYVAL